METRFIRIFSFFIPEGKDPAVYRDEVMERLEKFVAVLHGSGIYCCHENEKGIFGNSPERCMDILKTFEEKIKGIFDPANFIQEGFRPLPAYELLAHYIEYIHIKDALLSDGSVTPSGKGDGDVTEILNRFSRKTGDHFLSVEPHLAVFDGFAKLENSGVVGKRTEYVFQSTEEAYDTAVHALKGILNNIGCSQEAVGGFTTWIR
jgi:sugar phosphate isomerase/epimerase